MWQERGNRGGEGERVEGVSFFEKNLFGGYKYKSPQG